MYVCLCVCKYNIHCIIQFIYHMYMIHIHCIIYSVYCVYARPPITKTSYNLWVIGGIAITHQYKESLYLYLCYNLEVIGGLGIWEMHLSEIIKHNLLYIIHYRTSLIFVQI